jgi:hypothetical protein
VIEISSIKFICIRYSKKRYKINTRNNFSAKTKIFAFSKVGGPSVINSKNISERMYEEYACGACCRRYNQSGYNKKYWKQFSVKTKILPFQKWVVHP